jgi:tetratricopeptide (TPR) repeat protein
LQVRKDIYTYDTLAWALYKNKQFHEAAEAMQEALKLGTQDASLYYHAGKIHAALGQKDKAKMCLQKALAINPHFSLLQSEDAVKSLQALGG